MTSLLNDTIRNPWEVRRSKNRESGNVDIIPHGRKEGSGGCKISVIPTTELLTAFSALVYLAKSTDRGVLILLAGGPRIQLTIETCPKIV